MTGAPMGRVHAGPEKPNDAPKTPHLDAQSMQSPNSATKSSEKEDPFYGHRVIAEVSERMLMKLFACTHDSKAATSDAQGKASNLAPRLALFIAYALYRTRLPMMVTYYALVLLQRLKIRYPAARGSSGHRLFIAALMLASKMICDDSYNNKSWTIVGQGLFSLAEINQMERELMNYLDMRLDVNPTELACFVEEVQQFGAPDLALEDLCDTKLPAVTSPKREIPVGYKRDSVPTTPSPEAPRKSITSHRRHPSHRRCLSLRPDFWAQSNAISSSMPHRAESEWNVNQRSRTGYRASTPAQRTAPVMPSYPSSVTPMSYMACPASQHAVQSLSGSNDRISGDWNAMYAANNASSLSMATPSSVASSSRVTPATSFSDVASSPWNGVPPFHFTSPYNAQISQSMSSGPSSMYHGPKVEDSMPDLGGHPLSGFAMYPMHPA
ncbi:hypothetical protein MYAM1_002981 [Malassezia yamatoensis]|uniref:Cyclin N-terminal domain-containing protein n=1 Tax=Malassezia yamatoensis TaxID=253288 RepID=A0AAJ5YUX7_9BASI|nr:hypothetical protein MYAM1_002981 [Malassezia yamatoensis]